ncbi:hypothetical protein Tco_1159686 [Tanacetum coccineum]
MLLFRCYLIFGGVTLIVSFCVLVFGKLLEEIHVTWTQFGKKRDKIATLQKVVSRMRVQCLETALEILVTLSQLTSDGVRVYVTASERSRLKETLRIFGEATTSGFC